MVPPLLLLFTAVTGLPVEVYPSTRFGSLRASFCLIEDLLAARLVEIQSQTLFQIIFYSLSEN